MIVKATILAILAFLQVNGVFSQLQDSTQGMMPGQMWSPYNFASSYGASPNVWMDYIKYAHEAGKQLYQQWDKSGAADMFGMGAGAATQGSYQADKAAQDAAKVAHQAAKMGMEFAKQFFG